MDNEIKKLLFDTSKCLSRIDTFIGIPKSFDNYKTNVLLQQAVERHLEINGEL